MTDRVRPTLSAWRMAYNLLTPGERRRVLVMVAIALVGAAGQVAVLGAVFAFLEALSTPSQITESRYLALLYGLGDFSSKISFIQALGLGAIGVIVLSSVIQTVKVYAVARFTFRRMHAISVRLARSYLRRDYAFFLGRNSSDLGKRILAEAQAISTSFLQPSVEVVSSTLATLAIVGFLLLVNPGVTLAGAAMIGTVYGGIYAFTRGRLRRAGEMRVAANRERFSAISEAFAGIKDIKVLGKEDVFFRKFETASARVADVLIYNRVVSGIPRFIVQGIFFAGIVIVCLVLIDPESVSGGAGAVSEIVPLLGVFALAGQRLIPEAQRAYAAMGKIAFGTDALRSVHEDMSFASARRPAAAAELEFREKLTLSGVSFRYPDASRPSLEDIFLEIVRGERIGLVGSTGSGKTTLADILLGLLLPTAGDVSVDDRNLETPETWQAWKERVGYVPQDIFVADGTLAENIALGVDSEQIDHARLRECLRQARLDDVVEGDPAGIAMRVGERGSRLSGGQRQRVGIARALYHGADFIVLDEATSALDSKTEREVMTAIADLPRDVTVVMIAHRLSTLRGCDRIVVLSEGKVAESGTWEELETRNGAFASMLSEAT